MLKDVRIAVRTPEDQNIHTRNSEGTKMRFACDNSSPGEAEAVALGIDDHLVPDRTFTITHDHRQAGKSGTRHFSERHF
jgi:hypothetical protein